jgi:L-Ala-D/L-Glu epimerase
MNRRQFLTACSAVGCVPFADPLVAAAQPERLPAAMSSSEKPVIAFEKIKLELRHPWGIARGSAEFKENVFVTYRREGVTGVGEAGHLTAAGQTAEQTLQGLEQLRPLYERSDPWTYFELPDKTAQVTGATPPARAAMEMALMDWIGKKLGLPLHRLFGLDPQREVFTSFSIGLDRLEVMQQKAQEAKAYRILKVKLGRDDDLDIVKALRAVTEQPIRVDANEGWPDKETAMRKIEWLERRGVELVEQPLPRAKTEDTAWLKARTALPIIADEAVHTARDIPALAGAYTGVNIKIMKAGGWLESFRMFMVARAHGMEAMLGCMIESSAAINAAVQLQSLARWVDLDGNLLIKNDPFIGARFAEGRWIPSSWPGVGVRRRSEVDHH